MSVAVVDVIGGERPGGVSDLEQWFRQHGIDVVDAAGADVLVVTGHGDERACELAMRQTRAGAAIDRRLSGGRRVVVTDAVARVLCGALDDTPSLAEPGTYGDAAIDVEHPFTQWPTSSEPAAERAGTTTTGWDVTFAEGRAVTSWEWQHDDLGFATAPTTTWATTGEDCVDELAIVRNGPLTAVLFQLENLTQDAAQFLDEVYAR